MLQLKSLELQGFKSFPDKTLIEFANGITAIVGPNGSGKSNIADALRWAMGETSSKSLRGNKMEDVVFDGTRARKAQGYAQVTMTFDNSGHELDLDFDEVAISRKYFRSGESEYFINGSPVRLKDVQNLLRDTGLGKDGYSIIGQGAVTDIISAKSTDRRDVFEEAAGISGFKYRRDESARKLRLTEENMVRLGDILAELAGRLPVLEKQADKARRFLAWREEKKVLDIGIWLGEDVRLGGEIRKHEESLENLNSEVSATSSRMAYLSDLTESSEARSAELTAQIEEIRGDIRTAEEKLREHSGRILVLDNDISHARTDIARLQKESEESVSDSEKLIGRKKEIALLVEEQDGKIGEIDAAALAAQERMETKRKEDEAFYAESDRLRGEIAEQASQRNTASVLSAAAAQQKTDAEEKVVSLASEKADAEERRAGLLYARKGLEEAVSETKEKIEENNNMMKGQTLKYDLHRKKVETLTRELQDTKLELAKAENRYAMLRDMEQSHEGFAGSVHTVLREAKRGILQGIVGTVAEILKVPGEYATAIETALGNAIQNIVTENEADAKNAIFFLKSRSGGRATFLPITSVTGRKLDVRGAEYEEGYLGIASELISFEERYRGIVENLLGRTVVADNLDNASDMAKKYKFSFRIVTLDGQIVNAGGSMTGGSAAKNAGVFSRRSELEELTGKLSSMREKAASCEKETAAAQKEGERLSTLVEGIRSEGSNLEKMLAERETSLRHNIEYTGDVEVQIQAIEKEAEDTKALCLKRAEDVRVLEEKAAELSKKEALLTEELNELEARHSDLTKERDALQAEISDIRISRLEAENVKTDLLAQIERIGQELEDRDRKRQETAGEIGALEESILGYESEKRSLQTEIDAGDASSKAMEETIRKKAEERQRLEKKLSDCRAEEKDLYARKEDLIRELERITAVKNNAEEKLSAMQRKLWDEYEVTPSEARASYTAPENLREASDRADELKNRIRGLGEVNVGAIEEYTEVKTRHDTLSGQIADLSKAKANLEELIHGLENDMRKIFEEKFKVICVEFEKTFKELFGGGEARLSLTGSDDVLESGIDIYVAPPGKIIKNMSALSGGEQALTAISLYFALMKINPSPFCLLDEIESALDDVNVVRFAEYLYHLTDTTQVIAITHRRGTMEASDRLYGVTMREKGVSKVITINVSEIENHLTEAVR